MRNTYTMKKRMIAMILCFAMIATYLPGMIYRVNAASGNKKVDPATIHGWTQYFGSDVMSTEYTGITS